MKRTAKSYNDLRKKRAARTQEQTVRVFDKCPRCGAPLITATSYAGTPSEFWLTCSNSKCNTYVNTYIPQEHQEAFHKDAHRFKGNFGGYGTGKTLTDREEFYKHLFITPNGNGLIGANIMAQYEGTIKRDIEQDIPAEFVEDVSTQKSYINFINGYRLMFRPYDDPGKLRSLNLDFFIILEASEVKSEAYTQLQSRIRNLAATVQKTDPDGNLMWSFTKRGAQIPILSADWRQGIVESNPDSGWIKTEHLLRSDVIYKFGTLQTNYDINDERRNPSISSFIVASDQNEFLPAGFIADLKRNKPAWWISRYIEGSFAYSEGLVYPNALRYKCQTFKVPTHWKRFIAHDYGLVDPSVFLFAALDQVNGIVYFYKEVRATNRSIQDLAAIYKEASSDIPLGGLGLTPIIDPKSGPKRDYDKQSLITHYLDYGVYFQPGAVNIDSRIFKTNTYIEAGRVRIMDCCSGLLEELSDYKFKINKNNTQELTDKPEDKNNHSINCMEWIIMELPADPKDLYHGIYNSSGVDITKETEQNEKALQYWALQDDDEAPVVVYNYGGFF